VSELATSSTSATSSGELLFRGGAERHCAARLALSDQRDKQERRAAVGQQCAQLRDQRRLARPLDQHSLASRQRRLKRGRFGERQALSCGRAGRRHQAQLAALNLRDDRERQMQQTAQFGKRLFEEHAGIGRLRQRGGDPAQRRGAGGLDCGLFSHTIKLTITLTKDKVFLCQIQRSSRQDWSILQRDEKRS
jgi:hypothetical protein